MNKFYKKACPQYLQHISSRRGITILEILVTISIVGILLLVTLPQFSRIKESQIIKNSVEDIISALHTAQSESLASVNSEEYGVRFEPNQVIIFRGNIFSAGAVDNKKIDIISPSSISNVTLSGVSSSSGDVYFKRLSGVPSKTGTITVSLSSISKIITISASGAVSVN